MAIRSEELGRVYRRERRAEVLRFPTEAVRRRAARQARITMMRRRVAVASLLVVLVAGLLMAGGVGVSSPTDAGKTPRAVTVAPGETLWDLAERYGPAGGDPRAYIYEIKALNDLDGVPAAGSRLKLP